MRRFERDFNLTSMIDRMFIHQSFANEWNPIKFLATNRFDIYSNPIDATSAIKHQLSTGDGWLSGALNYALASFTLSATFFIIYLPPAVTLERKKCNYKCIVFIAGAVRLHRSIHYH